MERFTQALDSLLHLLVGFGSAIAAIILAFELWLRGQLTTLGVAPPIQTVLLVAVAVLLIVATLRLFGGLIRLGVVLVLVLIAIQILAPVLHQ